MSHCPIDLEGQSPSRTLSQASTIATEDNTALQSPRPSNWAVVIQSLDDNCILHDVAVNPAETGERIWSHVREQVITLSILACIWNWLLACFTRTIVGTATMTQVGTMRALQIDIIADPNLPDDAFRPRDQTARIPSTGQHPRFQTRLATHQSLPTSTPPLTMHRLPYPQSPLHHQPQSHREQTQSTRRPRHTQNHRQDESSPASHHPLDPLTRPRAHHRSLYP